MHKQLLDYKGAQDTLSFQLEFFQIYLVLSYSTWEIYFDTTKKLNASILHPNATLFTVKTYMQGSTQFIYPTQID